MLIDIANDTQALLLLDSSSTTAAATSGSSILFFWADWHAPSSPGGSFHVAIQTLADSSSSRSSNNNNVTFYRVLAEGAPNLSRKVRLFLVYNYIFICGPVCLYFCFISILLNHTLFLCMIQIFSSQYDVHTVPTFLFINSKGDIIDRIDGGDDVAAVARGYSRLIGGGGGADVTSSSSAVQHGKEMQLRQQKTTSDTTITLRLENLIKEQRIMIFMKGVPSAPRCGFSKKICAILDSYNAPYGAFDILTDEEVRQGLKEYSDWPTYPQLYVDGELVGGLDIVQEMVDDGELENLLKGE